MKGDRTSCFATDAVYNVVFSAFNSSGFVGYIVVSEDPATLVAADATLQVGSQKFDSTACPGGGELCYFNNWAGYEVYSLNNGQSKALDCGNCNTIYNAAANVNQPTPVWPAGGCLSGECDVAAWVGLEDQQGAVPDGNLAQVGTDATCVGPSCRPTYRAWYEMLQPGPAGNPVYCTGVTINGGDSLYFHVQNDASMGGVNTQYDFQVWDYTTGQGCDASYLANWRQQPYAQMTTPHYGVYIVEWPNLHYNGIHVSLAGFNPITFSSAQLYCAPASPTTRCTPDSSPGVPNEYNIFSFINQNPYHWDFRSTMVNCYQNQTPCVVNVNTGSVLSTGTFTEQWQTSQYTCQYSCQFT